MRGSHEKCGPGIVKWPVSCSPTFSSQVTDILHFLSAKEDAPVRFIVASEATNFRHLYLIQATPPPLSTGDSTGEPPLVISKATLSVQQLTTGDWIVFGSDVSRHIEELWWSWWEQLHIHMYHYSIVVGRRRERGGVL